MAAKKRTAKRTTKRTSSRGPRETSAQPALRGRAARGTEMTLDLGPTPMAAGAPQQEKREPRPYTTRYPIPDKQFANLKAAAVKAKTPKGPVPA